METLLYEGKAKKLFITKKRDILRVVYKDEATAFNGEKKASFPNKGKFNNGLSAHLFEFLNKQKIRTHFIEKISDTEQLVEKVKMIPLEVVVRNIVAGSLAKRTGLEEGVKLKKPIVEFYYKDDDLNDPLLNRDHIIKLLNIISHVDYLVLESNALDINRELKKYFVQKDILLVDFKLEFGYNDFGNILLADEISPDTCRLWDAKTKQKLDKDVFRRDLADLSETYEYLYNRILGG